MAKFVYRAFDKQGAKLNGEVEASDLNQAKAQLKKDGLFVQQIKPYSVGDKQVNLFQSDKVKVEDVEFLTAEISLLLESGVKIDRAIDILKKNKSNAGTTRLLNVVSDKLRKGSNMADALAEFPEIFDALYINLIRIGEASGRLSEVFKGLAEDLKFKRELKKKIIAAATYPMVIFFVCVVCIFAIFNFIVPRMSTLFAEADNLPIYTQIMLDMSDWIQNYQGFLLLGIALVSVGAYQFRNHAGFIAWLHSISLSLPGVKTGVYLTERIRFNSGLSLMLKAGVPIDKALELSAGNVVNRQIRQEMIIAKDKVKRGQGLSESLQSTSLYPTFLASLLEVGEESGELGRVFEEITNRSRNDFESFTQKITTLMEPLLILFMGAVVGSVVVVMLLSMVSVNDFSF